MKKIKVNLEMFKIKLLNKILHKFGLKCSLSKMSQEYITRVNKEYMSKNMEKTLLELYYEDNVNKYNLNLIETVYGKYKEFNKILNYKYKDFYEYYTKSHQFQRDLRKIKNKEEREYFEVYKLNSKCFLEYYSCSSRKN